MTERGGLIILLVAMLSVLLGAGCHGRTPSAIDTAWQEVHANPDSAEALIALGTAYAAEERYNEAFAHSRRAWEVAPNSFQAAHQLALMSLRLNDPHRALDWCDQALAIDPQSAEAFELKGRCTMTSGSPREAIPLFEKALRLDPNLGVAQLNLVSAHKVVGDTQAAVQAGARAVRLLPAEASAHFAYADALEITGQEDKAEERYREAITLDPDMAPAKLRLAQLLNRQEKKLKEAYRLAKEAHKLEPGDGTAEATAGWALFLTGEEREGLKTMLNAAEAHPYNHRTWLRLATASQRADYQELANYALAKAVRAGAKPEGRPRPRPSE